MKDFDQTNVKEVLADLKKEAAEAENCKGIVTCGLATTGKAWLVFFVLMLMFTPSAFAQERYIYNHPYYRNIKPSYNHVYVPSYRKYGNYGNTRYNLDKSYKSYKSQSQRFSASPYRLGQ